MSGLEQARRAKRDLSERLATVPGVVGVGLARQERGYVVVVRLAQQVHGIPDAVTVTDPDGRESEVAVRCQVVGTIRPE
ncbi:hypothetical protein [Bounagaea algeriensis]